MSNKPTNQRRPKNPDIAEVIVETMHRLAKRFARTLQSVLFFKILLKNARSYTRQFTAINSIDGELKTNLLPNVRRHQIKFAQGDVWNNVISFPFIAIYLLIVFFSVFISPAVTASFIVNNSWNTPFSSTLISLAVLLNFLNVLWAVILLAFLTELMPTHQVYLSLPTLLLFLLVSIPWLNSIESETVSSRIAFLILSSVICQASFLFGLAIGLVGNTLGKMISLSLLRRYNPDAFIVHEIVKTVAKLDNESKSWVSVEFRHQIIYSIEQISSCIERDLNAALRTGDNATDKWLKQATDRIASSLRQKMKWLLTPKADTQLYLRNYLTDFLTAVVNGNWDSLDQEEPVVVSVKQRWAEQTSNILRVIFIGGVPIILLWLIQNSTLALNAPFDDYAMIGTLLWAIFTTITTYDPLFSMKISAMKDVINLLPFSGSKP